MPAAVVSVGTELVPRQVVVARVVVDVGEHDVDTLKFSLLFFTIFRTSLYTRAIIVRFEFRVVNLSLDFQH